MIAAAISAEKFVVLRGTLPVSPQWRDLTEAEWDLVQPWRDCFQTEETAVLQTVVFAENSPHDASLRDFVEHIKTQYKARELAVLYLHRGHQLDIRSPILQWLLNLLDLNRNVFAIRVEDERAAADALSMACALLGTHSNVLVLKDDLERIGLRDGRVSNEVGYTVLARDRRDVPTLRESPAPSLPTHVREMSH